jgi:5-oxoprolinase (ATP-hydrolysing)
LPEDAGLLSAAGLGAAREERVLQQQVLAELSQVRERLMQVFHQMTAKAWRALMREGIAKSDIEVRRRILRLRLTGQESSLEIEFRSQHDPAWDFVELYARVYGYRPPDRAIEVESLCVIVSTLAVEEAAEVATAPRSAQSVGSARTYFSSGWQEVPFYERVSLRSGDTLAGPALVLEEHASLVIEAGWTGHCHSSGTLILDSQGEEG